MKVLKSNLELKKYRDTISSGKIVALVPTMGALHKGHLSLVDLAQARSDHVMVSIFVNPIQFDNSEDLAKYPVTIEKDLELLASKKVDAVFLPEVAKIYPPGHSTRVVNTNPEVSEILCGASRPGHFDGVLTIVLKLFNMCRPHIAVFGEKDFQQLALVRQMATDLDLPVQIVPGPIMREDDGLAMSSRNQRLNSQERGEATLIYKAMMQVMKAYNGGLRDKAALLNSFQEIIESCRSFSLDYVELRNADSLLPYTAETSNPVLLCAVFLGKVRLIDNLLLR